MTARTLFAGFLLASFLFSCAEDIPQKNILESALSTTDPTIKRVMDSVSHYDLQIRYTRITRYKDSVSFKDYDFRTNQQAYFYPGNTVGLLTAVLSLEKLNELDKLDLHSRFYIEGDTLETTFTNEITKILTLHDNEANDRLFEFLGQDRINNALRNKEIFPVCISHRLSPTNAFELTTKPIIAYLNDSTTTPLAPSINTPPLALNLPRAKRVKSHKEDDSSTEAPIDLSLHNYFPLEAQNQVLKRIFFPDNFPAHQQFNLSTEQYHFLRKAMQVLATTEKSPSEVEPLNFLSMQTKEADLNNIAVYHKSSHDYHTFTDYTYIKDSTNKVEFMLNATILETKNHILNDSFTPHDTLKTPFLTQLAREIYTLEVNRNQ
ncbi:hypothetical protein SAMN04487911_11736 [Arenibacter nanhaiticus]|uniref:Beta-lactamase enzyme family protein n=1 Tax=Arenibacter nanhaiticus TaxID=558155 RepID=A0A1M6ICU7_9FLAO|nr:hypothetical protein [Arenibacter nanhaiticus]SHJ32278.1 hypothetical protein SAMN04487911_11736 [Arenibacter nanhaiticus]